MCNLIEESRTPAVVLLLALLKRRTGERSLLPSMRPYTDQLRLAGDKRGMWDGMGWDADETTCLTRMYSIIHASCCSALSPRFPGSPICRLHTANLNLLDMAGLCVHGARSRGPGGACWSCFSRISPRTSCDAPRAFTLLCYCLTTKSGQRRPYCRRTVLPDMARASERRQETLPTLVYYCTRWVPLGLFYSQRRPLENGRIVTN